MHKKEVYMSIRINNRRYLGSKYKLIPFIKNIVEKEKLEYGIILSMNNLNCSNSKIKFIPLYMTMFIKN